MDEETVDAMTDSTCFHVPGEVAADLDAYLYRRRKAGEEPDGTLARVIREGIRAATLEDAIEEMASAPLDLPEIEFPEFRVEDFDLERPFFDGPDPGGIPPHEGGKKVG